MNSRLQNTLTGLVLLSALTNLPAHGEIYITNDSRAISTTTGSYENPGFNQAFDSNLSNDLINASSGKHLAHMFTSQMSGPFSGSRWLGDGTVEVQILPDGKPNSGAWAKSELSVQFTVTEAVSFNFNGFCHGPSRTEDIVTLKGPDGVVDGINIRFGGNEQYVTSGTLKPGVYHLDSKSSGTASSDPANRSGSFHFELVVDLPNKTPIPLHIIPDGNRIILTWSDPAFTLQSSPKVNGVFTNIPGATSPYTISATEPQQFFRLIAN